MKESNSMETWDAIRARRNVRSYRSDAVPDADLERIAEAAWRGAGHIAGAAAAIALVVPVTDDDHTRLVDYYDLGQATYAMMITAADLGIGTGHSSVGDQAAAREILGVPDDQDVAYLLGIGYPADRPLRPIVKPTRRPIGEVIRHGRW
jgi:nitroreductase